ncbi:MAG: UDP-N-acetylglucosamine diphosphorylase [Puniceicoccaceae bacterium]
MNSLPWEWLGKIAEALEAVDLAGMGEGIETVPAGFVVKGSVFIHRSVSLPPYGYLEGPAYIGPETEIRPGAYLRGRVIVEGGAVLGNSCEFKNCLLLRGAQVPHFSYVGDSILGEGAHLGAGAILSNLRFDQKPVVVKSHDGGQWPTGLRKFGAILGDGAEVGCNAVLQPGTLVGKLGLVAPGCTVGGSVKGGTLVYTRRELEQVARDLP